MDNFLSTWRIPLGGIFEETFQRILKIFSRGILRGTLKEIHRHFFGMNFSRYRLEISAKIFKVICRRIHREISWKNPQSNVSFLWFLLGIEQTLKNLLGVHIPGEILEIKLYQNTPINFWRCSWKNSWRNWKWISWVTFGVMPESILEAIIWKIPQEILGGILGQNIGRISGKFGVNSWIDSCRRLKSFWQAFPKFLEFLLKKWILKKCLLESLGDFF